MSFRGKLSTAPLPSSFLIVTLFIPAGCPANFFGTRCDKRCPRCLHGGRCHEVTGECVCPPGFVGSQCETGMCNRMRWLTFVFYIHSYNRLHFLKLAIIYKAAEADIKDRLPPIWHKTFFTFWQQQPRLNASVYYMFRYSGPETRIPKVVLSCHRKLFASLFGVLTILPINLMTSFQFYYYFSGEELLISYCQHTNMNTLRPKLLFFLHRTSIWKIQEPVVLTASASGFWSSVLTSLAISCSTSSTTISQPVNSQCPGNIQSLILSINPVTSPKLQTSVPSPSSLHFKKSQRKLSSGNFTLGLQLYLHGWKSHLFLIPARFPSFHRPRASYRFRPHSLRHRPPGHHPSLFTWSLKMLRRDQPRKLPSKLHDFYRPYLVFFLPHWPHSIRLYSWRAGKPTPLPTPS